MTKDMVNPELFHNECLAIGIIGLEGVGSDGGVQCSDARKDLVSTLVLAHGKALGSPECNILSAMLGKDSPEWAAYVEARNAPQRLERQRQYQNDADPLIMKALETASWTKTVAAEASRVILEIDEKAWIEWKAKKEAIRTELPYETEDME